MRRTTPTAGERTVRRHRSRRRPAARHGLLAGALAAALAGCTADPRAPAASGTTPPDVPGAEALRPTPLPDLSDMTPAVREQIRERYAALTAAIERADEAGALSEAYGAMGAVLMAARYVDAARALLPQRAGAGAGRQTLAVLSRAPLHDPRRLRPGRGGARAGPRAAARRRPDTDLARRGPPGAGPARGGRTAVGTGAGDTARLGLGAGRPGTGGRDATGLPAGRGASGSRPGGGSGGRRHPLSAGDGLSRPRRAGAGRSAPAAAGQRPGPPARPVDAGHAGLSAESERLRARGDSGARRRRLGSRGGGLPPGHRAGAREPVAAAPAGNGIVHARATSARAGPSSKRPCG